MKTTTTTTAGVPMETPCQDVDLWQPKLKDSFEVPLPFGYHLDLDFLRFCTSELVRSGTGYIE